MKYIELEPDNPDGLYEIPSLESGNSSPEQWVNGVKISTPYVPSTDQSDQLDRKVIVTPNPYRDDGAHAYENRERTTTPQILPSRSIGWAVSSGFRIRWRCVRVINRGTIQRLTVWDWG